MVLVFSTAEALRFALKLADLCIQEMEILYSIKVSKTVFVY